MKYVIDVPNNMIIKSALNGLTLGIPMLVSSTQKEYVIPTNLQLNPYIEPVRKAIEDKVWEFVKEIILKDNGTRMSGMFENELNECFGYPYYSDIFANLSYQEAKTKYNEWLRKNHDGCKGCKYDYKSSGEEPCFSCKQNYLDKWEATE